MNTPTRRHALLALVASMASLALPAAAQVEFPRQKPITLVVPFAPGGGNDILARAIAPRMSQLLGQTIVIDNRPGAGGNLGTELVARAAPDGYTLVIASSQVTMNPFLDMKVPFRIERDFEPVGLLGSVPIVLVANMQEPYKTLPEFIAYAKANPGKLAYASSGPGSTNHLCAAMLEKMAGIEMLHVPYRGTGPAVTDLLGGRIDAMFSPALVVTPHIAAGTLRVIGVTGAARSALFPDFPTVAETGLAHYSSLGWFGLFAPAGTPREVVAKVSADTSQVLGTAEAKQRLAEQGAEPAPNTPEAFTAFVNADIAKWLDLARATGIRLSN